MHAVKRVLSWGVVLALASLTVRAQAPITAADLSRLETSAAEVEQLAAGLKKTDATLAADVGRSLAEVREEITYLKVKLRREGQVTREEYASLRDRIETLRIRAQGQRVSAQPVMTDEAGRPVTVPAGAELEVRLQAALNSGTAKLEQRFEATLLRDYLTQNIVVIPAGAIARGFVSSVRAAGRVDRRGSLTLSFDELRIDTRAVRLRASVIEALDPKMTDDISRIGAGAVAGGIAGGLLGGGKGALLGVLIAGGGTMAATDGPDVDLPLGTVLRIRLDQPLEVFVR